MKKGLLLSIIFLCVFILNLVPLSNPKSITISQPTNPNDFYKTHEDLIDSVNPISAESYSWQIESNFGINRIIGYGDLDQDSKLELWTYQYKGDSILRCFEANGSNSYSLAWQSGSYPQNEIGCYWKDACDTDKDGLLEIIGITFTYTSEYILRVWEYTGIDNSFQEVFNMDLTSYFIGGCRGVSASDIDGDNIYELVIPCNDNKQTLILENSGNNNYIIESFITDVSESIIPLGDIDQDGNGDLILGGTYADQTVRWYESNGSNSYTQRWTTTSGYSGSDVSIGDLDDDGWGEIYIETMGVNFRIFEATGDNTIELRYLNSSNGEGYLCVVDSDANGYKEIIRAFYSGSGQKFEVLEAVGNDNYTTKYVSPEYTGNPFALFVDDFDGDGYMELTLLTDTDQLILQCSINILNSSTSSTTTDSTSSTTTDSTSSTTTDSTSSTTTDSTSSTTTDSTSSTQTSENSTTNSDINNSPFPTINGPRFQIILFISLIVVIKKIKYSQYRKI